MNRPFAYLATALVALGLSAAGAFASDRREAADATYKLFDGTRGICSMTHVAQGEKGTAIFTTAAHCVDGNTDNLNTRIFLTEFEKNGKEVARKEVVFYLKPIRTLKSLDVALLETREAVADEQPRFFNQMVDIATLEDGNRLSLGDELMALGFPQAGEKTITRGEFTDHVASILDIESKLYKTTIPLAGGSSGGGLYVNVDDEWKLVGIASAKANANDFMSYFSPVQSLRQLLRGYTIEGSKAPQVDHSNPMLGPIDER